MNAREWAPVVLRLGLAALFLWFGLSQLADPSLWTSWVPAWATGFGLESEVIVLLNGSFEMIAGALLAFGIYTRWVSAVLTLHMLVIVIDIGFSPIGIRDAAIGMSTLALALFGEDRYSLLKRL